MVVHSSPSPLSLCSTVSIHFTVSLSLLLLAPLSLLSVCMVSHGSLSFVTTVCVFLSLSVCAVSLSHSLPCPHCPSVPSIIAVTTVCILPPLSLLYRLSVLLLLLHFLSLLSCVSSSTVFSCHYCLSCHIVFTLPRLSYLWSPCLSCHHITTPVSLSPLHLLSI